MNTKRPYTIQFEGLSVCNASCNFCPVSTCMTRTRGEMSDELFHKIIKEGKQLGIRKYVPFLNGEPFLHKKIFVWLDYMEKEGVNFHLYTNGSLLNLPTGNIYIGLPTSTLISFGLAHLFHILLNLPSSPRPFFGWCFTEVALSS